MNVVARLIAIAVIALLLPLALGRQSSAAGEPYEINAVLSLTGNGAFIGTAQMRAMQAIEAVVNRGGGIAGRPVKFVVKDDQSNPQVAVQLAQTIIAAHVPVILGPSLAAPCDAIAPLVQRDGPVLYCMTSSVTPASGGYLFATLPSTASMIDLSMQYFRARGVHRVASIQMSDASGQFADQGLNDAMTDPANKGMQIVDREHFAAGDISVAAQLARIKAANPDVLVIWVIGPPAATVLHGLIDAGMTMPIILSSGDLLPAFMRQFGALLPKETYMPAMSFYAGNVLTDGATRSALTEMTTALQAVDAKPDQILLSAWDPTLLVLDALKKLGPDVAPSRLRDYLVGLRGWVGANGPYDFRSVPQRGLGAKSLLMIRWDAARGDFRPVSQIGGRPIPE